MATKDNHLANSEVKTENSRSQTKTQICTGQITVMGSAEYVKRTINELHRARIIQGWEWSKLVATKNSGEFFAVAVRRIELAVK